MTGRCFGLAWLIVVIQGMGASAATLPKAAKKPDNPLAFTIPMEEISQRQRALLRPVLEKATLSARGPSETFFCQPEQYYFLLDHPDRAVIAWRRLGAKCVGINARTDGQFSWADENGSEMVWQTVHRGPELRVWYAEGKIYPAPLMPAVPVRAIVVLHHTESKAPDGGTVIHHQSDLYLQTDSKAATMMTKMLGASAGKMAENGLGQLQLFFSALSWYLERHPDQAQALLRPGE